MLQMIGVWLALACCGALGQTDTAPVKISSLAELNQLTIMNEGVVASIDVEGTVWWSSKTEGRVILNDDTATLQLELDLPCQMPELGDRLILEGDCTATKTRDGIKLSGVPVVDHDGLHPPEENSGTIYLKAGRHPIRVAWFDRADRYALTVHYEGPDLPRQLIPDEVLFRPEVDAETGKTNLVNGLDYRSCEGGWWTQLPNFDHIAAVKSGVVDNFDITVMSRTNHVGVQFNGYINVPLDGEYTFYVHSDDGSRLFIGDSSLRLRAAGHEAIPAPRPVVMEVMEVDQPELQWVQIQGTVTWLHRSQQRLTVYLKSGHGLVRLNVAEDSDYSFTLRPQNRIRAVGVGRRIRDLDGSWIFGDFFVQHWDEIEQLHITPGIWNEYPVSKIEKLRTPESSNVVGSVVHLNGKIISMDAEQPMMLDDGTDRIMIDGSVPDEVVGRSLAVLGLLSLDGSSWVLRCTHFGRLGESGTGTSSLPVLTTAEQVSQLSKEEAARGYPVRLRGVITSPNEHGGAILQDSSRGIYLWLANPYDVSTEGRGPIALQVGDYYEIEGVTAPYEFNPFVQALRIQKLGVGALPEPVQPTWDQLINGSMQCNYVELEGVVASVKGGDIALLTRDGRLKVLLNVIGQELPQDVLGATVRIRGAMFTRWEEESGQVLVGSVYLRQHIMTVVHPAPADPFAIPLKPVGDLLQFDPQAGALQRVKVSGVLLHKDEQMLYLMDGENGLRFIPVDAVSAEVGDQVEVAGFSDLSGPSPLLHDALVRRIGPSVLPTPRRLKVGDLLRDEYDSTMVQMDGTLLSVSRRQNGSVLEMQSGLRRFLAMLDDAPGVNKLPASGSSLELTGIFVGQGGNRVLGRSIDSFQLHLNSIEDVRVLSRPSWWTFRRLMLVVIVLIAVLSAALIWIELLHRKVEDRTQQLGDQIRQRQLAEHQREIEQERARLAHDLHDDLGSGMTEMNILSSLVKNPAIATDKRNNYADKMSTLIHSMVSSLDEIVWAENPRYDSASSLADYFESYARRMLDPISVGCVFTVAGNVPDQPLNPRLRKELFLAFKEALTNVVKHAEASEVRLSLSVEEGDFVVVVSDNGCGIMSRTHEIGADGLAGMRKRLDAVGGRCDIQSHPAKGTTISLRVPIKGLLG